MYIYDNQLSGMQLSLDEDLTSLRSVGRKSYLHDRIVNGFLGRDESRGHYLWVNEGLGQQTTQDHVTGLMNELQPLFIESFSKNKKIYGPEVGKAVNFRIVADNDFKTEVEKEAKRLANNMMPLHLKFAPELVLKDLQGYYKAMQEPFPARLQTIDENTQLTREEKAAIFPYLQALTVAKAKTEADNIGGFYSSLAKEIIFRESQIDVATVAHEMAHAYAEKGWDDFINIMKLRGMKETDKLNEGMATHIERIIVNKWRANQPSNPTIPLAAYDSTYIDRANEFIKALGKDLAYEAYFGGWIDFKNEAAPEDTLRIGKTQQKDWQWTWRQPVRTTKAGHLRTCGDVRMGLKLCDLNLQIRFRRAFADFLNEVKTAYEQWVTPATALVFIKQLTKGLGQWHRDMINSKTMENDPIMLAVSLNYRITKGMWREHASVLHRWWGLIDL